MLGKYGIELINKPDDMESGQDRDGNATSGQEDRGRADGQDDDGGFESSDESSSSDIADKE